MNLFVKLGDVADVNPTVPKELRKETSLKVSFVAMASVSEGGRITRTEPRLLDSVLKGYRYFGRGDVLLAKITPCMENGKAAIASNIPTEVGFGSTEFHVIRPRAGADARYLFYMVWNARFRSIAARNMTGTAGQKRVPTDFLRRLEIPLPPLPEQRRIADILDKADAIRRKRQEALKLTDEFLRSAFLEMFGDPVTNPKGWPVAELESFSVIRSGVTKGRKLNGRPTVSVPYMRVANVQDGHIRLNEVKRIDVLASDVTKYALNSGDVLLTEGGDPDKLGRGAVWRGQVEPCIHQNHIFVVRPDKTVALPEYVSALIGSQRGKRYFLRSAKQTTGIASINKTQLRGFPALLPPKSLQQSYVTLVEQHRLLRSRIAAHEQAEGELFNSLVQRAFRGEL